MLPFRDMTTHLLTILRPPDLPSGDNPEERRKYMVKVARYHLNMSIVVALLFFGAVWAASPVGFARSNSVEEQIQLSLVPVHKQIAEASNEVKQVSEAQAENGKLLRMSLGNSVAGDIRFLKSKQCESKNPDEKERFEREIQIKQDEYRRLKQFEYSVPSCNAL